jgi:hypothetical protein
MDVEAGSTCWRHNEITDDKYLCDDYRGAESIEVNVPNHLRQSTMQEPNPNKLDGPCEIFIVTYHKDFPWLEYALKCIDKHCKGFAGITIVVPERDSAKLFGEVSPLMLTDQRIGVRTWDEAPGKGMLDHMVQLASADKYVPEGTKYVLTCDSDCMFRMPTTPEHYAWNDKPYCIVRSWESLTTEDPRNPGTKVVSDCAQWRGPTERQLGFKTPIFGMCMNTIMFPIDFFLLYRNHIESVHRRPFREFMLDGRNEFPQSNMDFTAMVSYAYKEMHNRFHWFHVEKPPYPVDRKQAYWSHGGITPEIRAQIEGFLA